jgi:hypothetical protein
MKTYLIGYDLNRPRGTNDYPDLIAAIKRAADGWWHSLDSTWIIKSNETAFALCEQFGKLIDAGDELLVVQLAGDGAWMGFTPQASDWLKTHL